ncbi:hypothetical protein HJG60_010391 [Phyllostomus discolor]|uniref:Uncharacterized protein n=1 Tax=Phyllostomus discolor TaxID=89673 RepID=A0A834B2Q5_9CHIR|nr:hypothetical protein HJG60_010391 [Phyllostomus discolor]
MGSGAGRRGGTGTGCSAAQPFARRSRHEGAHPSAGPPALPAPPALCPYLGHTSFLQVPLIPPSSHAKNKPRHPLRLGHPPPSQPCWCSSLHRSPRLPPLAGGFRAARTPGPSCFVRTVLCERRADALGQPTRHCRPALPWTKRVLSSLTLNVRSGPASVRSTAPRAWGRTGRAAGSHTESGPGENSGLSRNPGASLPHGLGHASALGRG